MCFFEFKITINVSGSSFLANILNTYFMGLRHYKYLVLSVRGSTSDVYRRQIQHRKG